jgi:hypothetical protein
MASNDTPVNSSFGGQYPVRVCDATLTVAAAATSATFTSASKFRGTVEKVEIDPGAAMATSATLKGYEANSPLTAPDYFLNFTFPASEVERVIYPAVATLLNTGEAAVTARTVPYVVNDYLRIDLGSAAAADSVRVRVYVRG